MITTADRSFADRQAGSTYDPFATTIITIPGEQPVDLTDVTVTFSAKDRVTGDLVIDDQAATGGADGAFTYQPDDTEVMTPGDYQGQIKLAFPGGKVHYTLLIDFRILANL